MSRRAQDAVRDQLVAAAAAERPRRRRRTTAVIVLVGVLLGATAVAEATRLLAVGEPIESLWPQPDAAHVERFKAPHGMTLSVTAKDADYRYAWGVSVYTSTEGLNCAIAGQVLGSTLGRERDGRFHPYGPRVVGSCGSARIPVASDMMQIPGAHPRTLIYGRVADPGKPPTFMHRGERRRAQVGPGGAFLVVFDGTLGPGDFKLVS